MQVKKETYQTFKYLLFQCEEVEKATMGRNTSVRIPEPFGGIINYRDDSINIEHVLIAFEYKRKLPQQKR